MKIIDIEGLSQADPYIIKHGDKFYIYSTGCDGVHCYSSKSLDSGWKYEGIVLSVAGQKEYWAPAVIGIDRKLVMYYSSMPQDSDDVHTQRIKVATSDSPTGRFEYIADVLPPFSIDAHPVLNRDGLYLFYSVNRYEGERVGTYIVCDKMLDIATVSGKPKTVVEPTLDQEIFERDRFRQGEHWHTIEGACYFRVGDMHYCTYSGNCYQKPTYHVGYAVCKSPSDKLNELDFIKHTDGGKYDPLIAQNGEETSTGHNSVIECDGKIYAVYHGRDIAENAEVMPRTARICQIIPEGDLLKAERS